MSQKNKKPNLAPIHNPELEKVIAELKTGSTPENQARLIAVLKQSKLLSPCEFDVKIDPKKKGPQNVNPQQIKFFLLNTNDGKTLFPTFTEIEKAKDLNLGKGIQPKFVVRTVEDFDKLLSMPDNKANGIVVNPGIDNIVIPAQLIAVANGRTAPKKAADTGEAPLNVRFGEPNVYPTRMANAIYEKACGIKEISRIWLKGKFVGPSMSFYLAVEADKHEESILNAIREVAVPMAKNMVVEVAFVTPEFKEKVIGDAVALYDKDFVLDEN